MQDILQKTDVANIIKSLRLISYGHIEKIDKERIPKQSVSMTLITKILMGTLGCVPAYDRYFIAGIKKYHVASGGFSIKSVLQISEFYIKNLKDFEKSRRKMTVENLEYPQMKLLDMCFWQVGFDLDNQKGLKIAH